MQILSKVSSTVAVKLSVIPPDCDPDGDEAEETHSGRLERTTQVFRFPGTVNAGTAWRQEKSCRLFCVYARRVAAVAVKVEDVAKRIEKALVKPFCEKTSQNFWRDLKKWSAFFYLPPPF